MEKKTILIHHHIFKNAGTSFNAALHEAFGDQFFEFDLPANDPVVKEDILKFIEDNPSASAISSHHAVLGELQTESYQTISSILIRDPLGRIESIYNFQRKQTHDAPTAVKARELDFKGFIEWSMQKMPKLFCNFQTHYCWRTEKIDRKSRVFDHHIDIALQKLSECAIVGTVENYSQFLLNTERVLSKNHPNITLKNERLNTTSSRTFNHEELVENLTERIGSELVNELIKQNQFDYQLHRMAEEMSISSYRSLAGN
ncbi:MAG: sulfotransferase family 2 domain-containing protein [Chloroflexota bacterium]